MTATMVANANLISCNISPGLFPCPARHSNTRQRASIIFPGHHVKPLNSLRKDMQFCAKSPFPRRVVPLICRSSNGVEKFEDPIGSTETEVGRSSGDNGGDGEGRDWTTSILLFVFWAGLMYYVFNLAPNQTPSRDMYFLEKLLNLKGDDGFRMNEVLVSLWYIMGLWPFVYVLLLLPTGRCSKGSIPLWPFLVMSFFGGAYALLPYFILWSPPPPAIEEGETSKWPLKFSESKLTAAILGASGLGLIIYAGLATGDWKEFYQYFQESKLVHATSVDFSLLSAFAPFWVYNDMTARKCYEKYSWLLPLSLVPFVGPSVYLLLRPSLETVSLQTSNKGK